MRSKRLLLFWSSLVFCLVCFSAHAQENDYQTGMLFDDEEYNQLPRLAPYNGVKFEEMPLEVDLSEYCPKPGNQGKILSCVGWAVGYGALTIHRSIQNGWTDQEHINNNANSSLFIYNQVKKGGCANGANISDAIEFTIENGDCLAKDFDKDLNDCSKEPDSEIKNKALQYAVSDYVTLFSTESKPKLKVKQVKKMLAQKRPVIIGMNIRENFMRLQDAVYWWPEMGATNNAGGHAMVVVGYDEMKEAFRLMNSWGEQWGKDGFIWIKYKHFGEFCKYAYVLNFNAPELKNNFTPSDNTFVDNGINKQVEGSFKFKYFDRSGRKPKFTDARVVGNQGVYNLVQKFELDQRFQLEVHAAAPDEYVYVFSIDPENKSEIHWPRSERLNPAFENYNESAWIPEEDAIITIPSEKSTLILTKSGIDHLYILFSKAPIDNIHEIIEHIQFSGSDDLFSTLNQLTTNSWLPTDQVFYDNEQMKFKAGFSGYNEIVPMVLKVEAIE